MWPGGGDVVLDRAETVRQNVENKHPDLDVFPVKCESDYAHYHTAEYENSIEYDAVA